jgi:hypothetical protein
MAQLCEQLENAPRTADMASCAALVARLENEYGQVRPALQNLAGA